MFSEPAAIPKTRRTSPIVVSRTVVGEEEFVVPPRVVAIGRAAFDAVCPLARPMTTPIAWYARRDRSCVGVVFRDHHTQTFVAATFRDEDG